MGDLLLLAQTVSAFTCTGLILMSALTLRKFEGDDYALARAAARPLLAACACLFLLTAISLARYWATL